MADSFGMNYEEFNAFAAAIRRYPDNAENAINTYLHEEGAQLLSDSITNHIPLSTGRYAAHRNLQKKYKHKKTMKHARDAKWFLKKEYNLGINIKNKKDYYYLYFVENGLGTSSRTGGVDFVERGFNDIYQQIADGLIHCLDWEEKQ